MTNSKGPDSNKKGLFSWFGKSSSDEDATNLELPPEDASESNAETADPAGGSATPELPSTEQQAIAEEAAEASDDLAKSDTTESLRPAATPTATEQQPDAPAQSGFFARLKAGLGKTRESFANGITNLFLGSKTIDEDLLEELETQLLMADVGIETTTKITEQLAARIARDKVSDGQALLAALQEQLTEVLVPCEQALEPNSEKGPFVILMVGVNGVGKTTTIGKLAKQYQLQGKSVMLAAGDTFRAAAVEQLQVWGERNQIPVVAQHTGADSASVVFDALQAAQSRNIDVLIADTAGRLHTKSNLMEELEKVKRVMKKLDVDAPHEVMLVLDAGTGQNALNQAREFHSAVKLTGLSLTKLDGTAKGGVIFPLANELGLPVRYIGVGEGIDDLRPFNAKAFVDALFAT